jgi:iron only hydrogenase large subunit-like protein
MNNIIHTSPARCQDCYRCVRECPLKSIALSGGQARVVEDKCVLCGSCVKACPQEAKRIQDDFSLFQEAIEMGSPTVVSVAPSVACGVDELSPSQVFTALKSLGVVDVRQVAEGANQVARAYRQLYESPGTTISSCCPAVVNLVEKHFPSLIPALAPVESPMVTHARMLKRDYPDAQIFFLGPCAAKIQEARELAEPSVLRGAITFTSLAHFLKNKPLFQADPEEGIKFGGLFPMTGGVLEASRLEGKDAVQVSGLESLLELFRFLDQGGRGPKFIEAMACRGGCLMGPAMACPQENVWERRQRVFAWTKAEPHEEKMEPEARTYQDKLEPDQEFTEEEIRSVLAKIGKYGPEDEANCGGCGYPSCRDKAIATLKGQAETQMCVSYMKEKFRSFANLVVRATPDGIIVVDRELLIQEFNPTAESWFNRHGKEAVGLHLSSFIDPVYFAQVAETGESMHLKEVHYSQYDLTVEELILPLPEYQLVLGIFRDLSEQIQAQKELDLFSEETINKATQVIDEHLHTAQLIAGLLAENAAETKATLWEVISLINKRKAD